MFIPPVVRNARPSRRSAWLVPSLLALLALGCHRYPTLDAAAMAHLLVGQVVQTHGTGPLFDWRFGPLDPSAVTVREVEQDGKQARVVVDLRTAGHGALPGSVVLGDGRLRISVEWIADTWTVMRLENISFEATPAPCATLFPAVGSPWTALTDGDLLHLLLPTYDPARGHATLTRTNGPEVIFHVATCAGGSVRAAPGSPIVLRARQILPDGRLALFVRTLGQNDEGNGGGEPVEELGGLVLLERHDQAAVAVGLGDWEGANLVQPSLRVEHLAGQSVFVEPAPQRTAAGDSNDHQPGIRIWVPQGNTLVNVGWVALDAEANPACTAESEPGETPSPWKHTRHSTPVFGTELVVRDDVTWERSPCAAASVPVLHPVHRQIERHYALQGLTLREDHPASDPPPPVR